jgi:hypothetical protein
MRSKIARFFDKDPMRISGTPVCPILAPFIVVFADMNSSEATAKGFSN